MGIYQHSAVLLLLGEVLERQGLETVDILRLRGGCARCCTRTPTPRSPSWRLDGRADVWHLPGVSCTQAPPEDCICSSLLPPSPGAVDVPTRPSSEPPSARLPVAAAAPPAVPMGPQQPPPPGRILVGWPASSRTPAGELVQQQSAAAGGAEQVGSGLAEIVPTWTAPAPARCCSTAPCSPSTSRPWTPPHPGCPLRTSAASSRTWSTSRWPRQPISGLQLGGGALTSRAHVAATLALVEQVALNNLHRPAAAELARRGRSRLRSAPGSSGTRWRRPPAESLGRSPEGRWSAVVAATLTAARASSRRTARPLSSAELGRRGRCGRAARSAWTRPTGVLMARGAGRPPARSSPRSRWSPTRWCRGCSLRQPASVAGDGPLPGDELTRCIATDPYPGGIDGLGLWTSRAGAEPVLESGGLLPQHRCRTPSTICADPPPVRKPDRGGGRIRYRRLCSAVS